jgi:hypothetical protein
MRRVAYGNVLNLSSPGAAPSPSALDPMNEGGVRTYQVGSDVQWQGGVLTLPFAGNRIEIIQGISPADTARSAQVFIDGKRPSDLAGLYGFTRTTPYPGSAWPCLLRVTSEAQLQVEEWTLALKDVSPDLKRFKFELTGSLTGPDGEGSRESATVLAQGLDNGAHTLELRAARPLPIAAIRVYQPPLR